MILFRKTGSGSTRQYRAYYSILCNTIAKYSLTASCIASAWSRMGQVILYCFISTTNIRFLCFYRYLTLFFLVYYWLVCFALGLSTREEQGGAISTMFPNSVPGCLALSEVFQVPRFLLQNLTRSNVTTNPLCYQGKTSYQTLICLLHSGSLYIVSRRGKSRG